MFTEVQGTGRLSGFVATDAHNHLINASDAIQTALQELAAIEVDQCEGANSLPVRVQNNIKVLFHWLVDHKNDLEFEIADPEGNETE